MSCHPPLVAVSPQEIANRLRARDLLGVVDSLCSGHGVPRDLVLGRSRPKSVAFARNRLYAELSRTGLSYPEIGSLLDRDHTTVMAGVRRARRTAHLPVPSYLAEVSQVRATRAPRLRPIRKVTWRMRCEECGRMFEDHADRFPHPMHVMGCKGFRKERVFVPETSRYVKESA